MSRAILAIVLTSGLTGVAGPAGAAAPEERTARVETSRVTPQQTRVPLHAVAPAWDGLADARSGRLVHAAGPGIAIAADVSRAGLIDAGRQFIGTRPALFRAPVDQLAVTRVTQHADGHSFVLFEQRLDGVRVYDSAVVLHYAGPKLVGFQVRAHGGETPPAPVLSEATARGAARTWLDAGGAAAARVQPAATRVLFARNPDELRPAWLLTADVDQPRARYEIVVDAVDGQVLSSRNTIHYATLRLLGEVEAREAGDALVTVALGKTEAGSLVTDDDGLADTAAGSLTALLRGPHARINDQQAAEGTKNVTLTGGAGVEEALWTTTDASIEQLDAWHFINKTIARNRFVTPELDWFAVQLPVNINLNDTCNAFYDGSSINFFQAGGGCNNTARLLDVVAHEWGHGFHDRRSIQGINASEIQEGVADYVAVTITNDSELSPNFFQGGGSVRNVGPNRVYPDDMTGQVHNDGLVWGGAWWDLRTELMAKYGPVDGVYVADRLHSLTLRGGPQVTSAYADALLNDDDDGDVSNGTPNSCEINAAFDLHGLITTTRRPGSGHIVFDHTPPATEIVPDAILPVDTVPVSPSPCSGLDPATVRVHYTVDGSSFQTADLADAGGGTFSGEIPAQPAGAFVQYYLSAATDDAAAQVWTSPRHAPESLFGTFVGSPKVRMLWDFEDGGPEWTHGGAADPLADDWEIGAPAGLAWDPAAAYSGTAVAGNDLGRDYRDGMYAPGTANWLESPELDCTDCERTALRFMRWLNTAPGDTARITVNGSTVWEHTEGDVHDRQWLHQVVDISAAADGQAAVAVRFELDSVGPGFWGGWNIDDVAVVTGSVGGGGDGDPDPPIDEPTPSFSLEGGCQCSVAPQGPPHPGLSLLAVLLAGTWLTLRRRTASTRR